MKETRKRVADLNIGDNVKGYGVIRTCDHTDRTALVSLWSPSERRADNSDLWPEDAEVTVLVPERRWRVTLEITDESVAARWLTFAAEENARDDARRTCASVSVEEVEG